MRVFQADPETERLATEDVRRHRQERDNEKCRTALDDLRKEAIRVKQSESEGELMEALVRAAKADATLGEMQQVLRDVFGLAS